MKAADETKIENRAEELTPDKKEVAITTSEPELVRQSSPNQFLGIDDELPIKIVGPDDEEIFPEDIIVPPDGGWGWVVVFAAFMANLISGGSVFTFGALLGPIKDSGDKYGVSESQVAWVGGLQAGFYLLFAPFVTAMSNVFGFRTAAVAGGFVSFFAYSMTFGFNLNVQETGPNMIVLYICFGILGGLGISLIFIPTIVMVGYYFEKRRALATGISLCGIGIGTFIYAPMVAFLVQKFGWPKAIMIEGILLLTCSIFGALYRPLRPVKPSPEAGSSLPQITPSSPSGEITHVFVRAQGNLAATTSLLAARAPSGFLSGTLIHGIGSRTAVQTLGEDSAHSVESQSQGQGMSEITETPTKSEVTAAAGSAKSEATSGTGDDLVNLDRNFSNPNQGLGSNSQLAKTGSGSGEIGTVTVKTITLVVSPSEVDLVDSRVFRVADKETLNKPMNRTHVFYEGDLEILPDFSDDNTENINNVEIQVVPVHQAEQTAKELGIGISTPTLQEAGERKKKNIFKKLCGSSVFRKMLDFSLLKSITFLLFAFAALNLFVAFFVPFTYLKNFAKPFEFSDIGGTILISTIGVANTVGRVLCGFLADKMHKRVLLIVSLALIISGILTALLPFVGKLPKHTVFPFLVVYAVIFGLAIACYVTLRSIVLVSLMGLSNLTNGIGWILLFSGTGALIGSPLAGLIKEKTGNYNGSFHMAGAMIFIAGLLCSPLNRINRWEKKRREEKVLHASANG